MHTRQLREHDIPAYIAIRQRMLTDSPWSFASSPQQDKGSDPENLRRSLSDPDFAIFGVLAGEDLIAVAMTNRETRHKRRHIAWIMGVFVEPAHRGRGCGEAVVGACIAYARAWEGVAQIQLGVSVSAPAAKRLYERLGFEAWGLERDALRVDGHSHDEVHMVLPVG
jgi:RimJ/RimL family protein N-acetyltransferase